MRLLTQVLLVNLLLIAAAVLAAAIATNPENELRDTGAAGLVLGFALALTVAVNVFLLARRFRPLEDLTDEMEQVNLSQPWPAADDDRRLGGPGEVQRLERAFRGMLARLEAERRLIASAALEAQERERARVALDLHDEVNQARTGLMLRLEALRTKAPPELSAELAETRSLAGSAMDELLKLARQLRPTALDDLGLQAALAGLVDEVGRQGTAAAVFDCEAAAGPLSTLPAEVQLVIYRVAQEALSNVVRHADAEHIRVRLLMVDDDDLELRVSDDGNGFDAADPETGLGISGMRERALLVGGRLDVDSHPGLGTRVRLHVPAADEEAES
jgi:two-component system sensor histidine kinase UhpB